MTNSIHAWLYAKYQETKVSVKLYQDDIRVIKQRLSELSKPENHISKVDLRNYYSDKLRVQRIILKKHTSIAKYLKQEIRKHSK